MPKYVAVSFRNHLGPNYVEKAEYEWHRYNFTPVAGSEEASNISGAMVLVTGATLDGLPSFEISTTDAQSAPAVTSSTVAPNASSGASNKSSSSTDLARPRARPRSRTVVGKGRSTHGSDDDNDDALDEDYIFNNPNLLDITAQDAPLEPESPPHTHYPEPMSPDDPAIQVVRSFWRDDVEQCRLQDGRLVTRYEQEQLVNIGRRNQLLLSLGLGGPASGNQHAPAPVETPGLPATFQMPPPRQSLPRTAKASNAS